MKQITKDFLQSQVDTLNRVTNSPMTPYIKVGDKYEPQAKCYLLDGAYGGYKLSRMCDVGTGQHDVLNCGYLPKRELSNLIRSYLNGILDAKKEDKII
jgi:hypothetical protein